MGDFNAKLVRKQVARRMKLRTADVELLGVRPGSVLIDLKIKVPEGHNVNTLISRLKKMGGADVGKLKVGRIQVRTYCDEEDIDTDMDWEGSDSEDSEGDSSSTDHNTSGSEKDRSKQSSEPVITRVIPGTTTATSVPPITTLSQTTGDNPGRSTSKHASQIVAAISWRGRDFDEARKDVDSAIDGERSNFTCKESVFKMLHEAVRCIARRHKQFEAIFFVVQYMWKRLKAGPSTDNGVAKDILRRMAHKVNMDPSGEWKDEGDEARLICRERGGMQGLLDDVALDVMGETWEGHLIRTIQHVPMDPSHTAEEHFLRFQALVDDIPTSMRPVPDALADLFINSLPGGIASEVRIRFKTRWNQHVAGGGSMQQIDVAYDVLLDVGLKTQSGRSAGVVRNGRTKQIHAMSFDANEDDPDSMMVMSGYGGGPPNCAYCESNGRRSEHPTHHCYAALNPNSRIANAWRQAYAGGKGLTITETLCSDGSDEYEMEQAFKTGLVVDPVNTARDFVTICKRHGGGIKQCNNPRCHIKTRGSNDINLKKLRNAESACEANKQLLEIGKQLARSEGSTPSHTENIASLQAYISDATWGGVDKP